MPVFQVPGFLARTVPNPAIAVRNLIDRPPCNRAVRRLLDNRRIRFTSRELLTHVSGSRPRAFLCFRHELSCFALALARSNQLGALFMRESGRTFFRCWRALRPIHAFAQSIHQIDDLCRLRLLFLDG